MGAENDYVKTSIGYLFAKSILDFCMSLPFTGAFDEDPEPPAETRTRILDYGMR